MTELTRAERRRQAREAANSPAPAGGQSAAAKIDEQFIAPAEKPTPAAAASPALAPEAALPKPAEKPLPAAITKKAPTSRAERQSIKEAKRRAQQEAAERQAHVDSMRMPEPAPDNFKPGDTIPLHILNQRARQADEEARNEAADIGKAVGKFAEQQVSVRTPRSVMRSKKMRDAQLLMDRKRAETAKA